MSGKINCKIIQDLLPNYIESLTSKETNEYIQEHLKECNECEKILNDMKEDNSISNEKNDKIKIDYMKKVKNKLDILKIIFTSIITLICLILVSILGYMIYIFYDGILDKSNPMTRDEIIALLEEGEKHTNYYAAPTNIFTEDNAKTEIFVKDNKYLLTTNGLPFIWADYENDEEMLFVTPENSNTQTVSKVLITSVIDGNKSYIIEVANSNIKDYEHNDFEYIGEKKINSKEYILIKLYDKLEKNPILRKMLCTRVYISKENKVIEGFENYYFEGKILLKMKVKYNYEFDIVTDKNVEKPDLAGYEQIRYPKNKE